MKTETKRCDTCHERYLILEYGDGRITVTYYTPTKLLHSDGAGHASTHRKHRKPVVLDVLAEVRDGGLPNVSTECRCQVREVSLHHEIGELMRR